uniref:Uncharacterized protein n=1 Tax=Lepeophtheirus salmonis TaxID=72036 RepID=A0A0K2ULQ4_LEPSM
MLSVFRKDSFSCGTLMNHNHGLSSGLKKWKKNPSIQRKEYLLINHSFCPKMVLRYLKMFLRM